MTHEYFLWISLFAYAIHIYEETVLNWKDWAESVSGMKNLKWSDFFVANAAVIVAGVCAAQVGWRFPSFALLLPSLQLINGLFFHVIPTIVLRKFSPGVITSCLLFFPIAILAYWGAWVDNVLNKTVIILSLFFGSLVMALPFIFLKLQSILKKDRTL